MVKTKSSQHTLQILMNGTPIGTLEKKDNAGLVFTYAETWLQTPGARPISLSLPLINTPFTGDIVYNFFDNLLPDNSQIRSRIQARFKIPTSQPFDLLASIGKDCVGAIQLIDGQPPAFKEEILFDALSDDELSQIITSYRQSPLGMTTANDEFRISLAGAQEKSAFLRYQNKWCRPLGTTPTTHIFKLPIGFLDHQQLDLSDSCENEWLCLQIISAFGLPTARCEILKFNETKVLAVERFDRKTSSNGKWIMRLPQEDMCQALGVSPNLKYQSDGGPGIKDIMKLLLNSAHPAEDRDNFFRSQVILFLLAAIDGHAKNFSVFIEPNGKYRLTPIYDVISAYPMIVNAQLQLKKIKMAMALEGENRHYHWHNIQRRHFLTTAHAANYSLARAETVINEILNQVETVIKTVSDKLPDTFPTYISNAIFNGMLQAKSRLTV